MSTIKVHDRYFEPLITDREIAARIGELAIEISNAYSNKRPLFLAVLNGAFIFAADLLRQLDFPHEISFVKISSYSGTASTGISRELIGLNEELTGRHIIILDDILETGRTLLSVTRLIHAHQPASVSICTLLIKATEAETFIKADYCGFTVENRFVLGYGLDYDGYGRSLVHIYAEKGS